MENKRFPRNNNRNKGSNNGRNNGMRNNQIHITCPECSQQILILKGDIQYSLNLHMQSHKSLESIDHDIARQLSGARFGPNVPRNVQSNYACPECNEIVPVFNNDVKRSLEMHARNHQNSSGMRTRGDDQSSTSSGRSRSSNRNQNFVKNNTVTKSEVKDVLVSTFNQMQPGLKAHRGFVFENESGEIVCRLCNLKIDSLSNITHHLVTKSHEDNTIAFIKSKLPYQLHETMEFVSFYGSNLCCNLCGCKIHLSSLNVSETIMNIIAHNAGQQHGNKKGSKEPLDRAKEGIIKLNFLASQDSLINDNKHMISCEMQPQFKCKLCDKHITFDQNDQFLLKNFTAHLSSNGHKKCVRATSVLATFKNTFKLKGGKHNLVITKGSITCTVCNLSMEPTMETLAAHVKEVDSFTNIDWPDNLSASINNLGLNSPQQTFNMKEQNNDTADNKVSKLNALLKCMPLPYRNINYVVESNQGQVTCLICNCVIPCTFYNLKTHLTGNNHMKNLSSTEDVVSEPKLPNNSSTTTSEKSQNFNPFMKENSLPPKSETENDMGRVLELLKKNGDPLIRKNIFLLTKHNGNVYSCKLCLMTIPKSHDVESFKQSLVAHLSSPRHVQRYGEEQESVITNLLTVDPLIRVNKKYLEIHEEFLLCTLCDAQLTISIDGTKLKKNLTEHLKGQQHLSKVQLKEVATTTNSMESLKAQYHLKTTGEFANKSSKVQLEEIKTKQEAPKPAAFLSNSMENLKVQYHLNKASELANNVTKPSYMFPTTIPSPIDQFKGQQSSNKAEGPTRPLKPFLLQNPTEPLRVQPINVQHKEPSFEAPKPLFPNSISPDPIMQLFNKLPADFQSDIAFIKKSSVVEGFLACTLCNTNHINPPYLQKHLEEEKHVQGKTGRRPPSVQADTQNSSSSSKKMMQNMKNFFGLNN